MAVYFQGMNEEATILLTKYMKESGDTVDLSGIAPSLSIVPPVKPRPRPLILATGTPQAAAAGPAISVVLSPTPPVLCLSTLIDVYKRQVMDDIICQKII